LDSATSLEDKKITSIKITENAPDGESDVKTDKKKKKKSKKNKKNKGIADFMEDDSEQANFDQVKIETVNKDEENIDSSTKFNGSSKVVEIEPTP
jgi:hypothetical protein